MSFNDLESGGVQLSRASNSPGRKDEFTQLKDKLSISIFKINGNIQGINRIVTVLGTTKEQGDSRDRLHELLESTRVIVKNTSEDVRRLTTWDQAGDKPDVVSNTQAKINREFSLAIQSFQRVQKEAAERTKISTERELQRVSNQQQTVSRNQDEVLYNHQDQFQLEEENAIPQEQLQQQVQQPRRMTDAERRYQEGLIEERDNEIRDIETGIQELNDIFRDLGNIVVEQGGMLDNIESNVYSIASDTNRANQQLVSAHEYQRKAGKRAFCLLIILVIVVLIVVLVLIL
ncbi:t-SNARE [Wallemia mellicola]|uniref:t-SNARE n=1 Tax=Wallemia mellicola TaxID=1708541 RepID=A0A4T0PJG0_9BASI|nr:hypothetical protein E3Q24_03115 [Wallemia mellicola]TIB73335.1 hypothetical protein E3Q23_03060 [Wallemia mellicola]TIB76806.1 t-SNARE [Wallemia mellicola]TIB82857.1 t-SNARE [Wallemia mellicola]TIB85471.1 t-SNARE [Wallemia mellicola]